MASSTINSTRGEVTAQEIIEIAEIQLGKFGQSNFQVAPICKKLQISPGVVNYHFKGRDDLMVRTAFYSYAKYVEGAWDQALKQKPNVEKALAEWVDYQINWASEFPGIAALINFPSISGNISELIANDLSTNFREKGTESLINMATLIRNVRDNNWSLEKINPQEVYNDSAIMLMIAKFGWTALGISTWMSGRHLPSSQIIGSQELVPKALEYTISDLISQIKQLSK